MGRVAFPERLKLSARGATMDNQKGRTVELVCPCCGARLKVDRELGKVVAHESPPKRAKPPDLAHATRALEKQAARREALFKQSAEEEKVKSQVLESKFKEALKRTRDEPVAPPLRDIDLD
ncbi:MAG: hypothetical protein DMG23_07075 [Acidobacteria bacterium]|nr:MAG: hypothetical protein DMG23_07075 [Acidobacteriota bacterium]